MPNAPYEYFASRRREDVKRIVALEKNIEHAVLMRQGKENVNKVPTQGKKHKSAKIAKSDKESVDLVTINKKNKKQR